MESREAIADWIAKHGAPELQAAFAQPDFDLFYYHEARRRREFPGTSLVLPGYRLAPLTTISFDAMEDEIAFGGGDLPALRAAHRRRGPALRGRLGRGAGAGLLAGRAEAVPDHRRPHVRSLYCSLTHP